MNYYVNFKGDARLTGIIMNVYWKQGCPRDALWIKIQGLLVNNVLERELPMVQAIVGTWRKPDSKRNAAFQQVLLQTSFRGYPLIQWATELEMSTEMRQFLMLAGFKPKGTSNIPAGSQSIISLVIDHRKWAFEDVKLLIRKGHDVKGDRWEESPFDVALEYHRYDIAKLLLFNGAQTIPTIPHVLYTFVRTPFSVEALYLLITSNRLQSASIGENTFLLLLLKNYTSLKRYVHFHHYKNMILLILENIDIFFYEDRKALLDYQSDKSLSNEILEKIYTILYEPNSLMNICRKRLHRHYRCHFHSFIDILIDEAFPKSITDYLQCKDLLMKYFRAEDIEALDNSLAGITLKNCTFS